MLRNKTQEQSSLSVCVYFLLDVFLIVCEFIAELSGNIYNLIYIIDKLHLTKYNYAFYAQSPAVSNLSTLIVYAEGDFIALLQSVQTVSEFAAVEINTAVGFIIKVVHGHSVGVALVTDNRQHSALLVIQYLSAFLGGKLKLFSVKFSEHRYHLIFHKVHFFLCGIVCTAGLFYRTICELTISVLYAKIHRYINSAFLPEDCEDIHK